MFENLRARRAAHCAFDPLWKGAYAPMTRAQAYRWLARQLGLDPAECHIAQMDTEQCSQVESICWAVRRRNTAHHYTQLHTTR